MHAARSRRLESPVPWTGSPRLGADRSDADGGAEETPAPAGRRPPSRMLRSPGRSRCAVRSRRAVLGAEERLQPPGPARPVPEPCMRGIHRAADAQRGGAALSINSALEPRPVPRPADRGRGLVPVPGRTDRDSSWPVRSGRWPVPTTSGSLGRSATRSSGDTSSGGRADAFTRRSSAARSSPTTSTGARSAGSRRSGSSMLGPLKKLHRSDPDLPASRANRPDRDRLAQRFERLRSVDRPPRDGPPGLGATPVASGPRRTCLP